MEYVCNNCKDMQTYFFIVFIYAASRLFRMKTPSQSISKRSNILSEIATDLILTSPSAEVSIALQLFAAETGAISREVLQFEPRRKKTTYILEVGHDRGGFRTDIEAHNPEEAKALALADAHPWVDTSEPLTVDLLEITRL